MVRLVAVALALITFAVFWNGLGGAFVYDDSIAIRDNPLIRHLWPLSDAMSLPAMGFGITVSGRPVLSLSFALNRALLGPEPWHYRMVNIAIHILAGLLLFGVVRRTVDRRARQSGYAGQAPGTMGLTIAFGCALIWLVHPLQTASVTYIVQRAESLAGFFLLVTLYAAIRRFDSGKSGWAILATVACLLGMGTKESMFAAPLLVLLYDYTFISGDIRRAVRSHGGLYAGLAVSWLLFAILLLARQRSNSQDFELGGSSLSYALTQPNVILYYLRLSVWPWPMLAAYAWPYATTIWEVLPPLLVVLSFVALTVWGLWRRSWAGFLGAWFFLILAPSSSVAALGQVIQCQRMYLPLAVIAVFAVVGVYAVAVRIAEWAGAGTDWIGFVVAGVAVLTAIPLAYGTILRNQEYREEFSLWQDNVVKQPNSRAAQIALGKVFVKRNQISVAEQHFRRALEGNDSASPSESYYNLGVIALGRGRFEEALSYFQKGLALRPFQPELVERTGAALAGVGRFADAVGCFEKVLEVHPNPPVAAAAHNDWGTVLSHQGKTAEAAAHYRVAVQLRPDYPEAFNNLGSALQRMGRYDEAVGQYEAALRLNPHNADIHNNIGAALLNLRRFDEAERHLQEALRIRPSHVLARQNLQEAVSARKTSLAPPLMDRDHTTNRDGTFAP